ncbi:pyrimidine reductase family protein [Plantactinospora sp. KLBMP9567]|uniref:pyrimidine reductase family protein n=1 Tax=Plantactinospora sp. KLBMP9567 TaxID=3085900 RepID=UPI002981A871|nr:pyrimidine reductase family protein [Plantactinospora sp. KLBMP9567]MDW5326836.1 pyrimidine reductase family protein [Plantactinospora sp. KLBMP9567]
MTGNVGITRLWPEPAATALDDPALIALYPRLDRPHLRMNFVASIDGAVELDGHSAGLSSAPDKRVFGLLRMVCDALLVGAGTLRHEAYRALRLDERRRAWRREHGLAEYPTLVVVSRALNLDPESAAFADAPVRPVVLSSERAEAPAGLADVAELLRHGEEQVDLAAGLAELHRHGHGQLLSEGGPHLFGSLTAAGLLDEVCLTVAPMLAGPGAGRITAGPTTRPHGMSLRHVLAAGDELLLRYVRS